MTNLESKIGLFSRLRQSRLAKSLLGLMAATAIVGYAKVADAVPPMPVNIYGTISTASGDPLDVSSIEAKINNVDYTQEFTTIDNNSPVVSYLVTVLSDDPETTGVIEGGVKDDIVTLYVNGKAITPTWTWNDPDDDGYAQFNFTYPDVARYFGTITISNYFNLPVHAGLPIDVYANNNTDLLSIYPPLGTDEEGYDISINESLFETAARDMTFHIDDQLASPTTTWTPGEHELNLTYNSRTKPVEVPAADRIGLSILAGFVVGIGAYSVARKR